LANSQNERRFDPRQHLRRLPSGAEYLDVKWRLAWMRSEHPNAQIETELLRDDEDGALFKATVRLSDGGSAMAHASVPRDPQAGYIEQAESKAVGRALAALGYGAEYADDDLVSAAPPVTQPVASAAPTPAVAGPPPPTPLRPTRERDAERVSERVPELVEERPVELEPRRPDGPRRLEETRGPDERRPAPLTREPEPDVAAAPAPATPTTGAAAAGDEDVSWNKFWIWAKRRGYRDANHLREILGDNVMQHTPQEVRAMLVRHELDTPPPGTPEE
jgi:hypothetical protein